ncbi:MAG: hypothetical protein MZV49_16085 [Rhodopseudomonas palustris]|nr:hypothetical protein [Rhodopseudomonas palustris]
MKDLKQSTKQRFGALDFDYPDARRRGRDRRPRSRRRRRQSADKLVADRASARATSRATASTRASRRVMLVYAGR